MSMNLLHFSVVRMTALIAAAMIMSGGPLIADNTPVETPADAARVLRSTIRDYGLADDRMGLWFVAASNSGLFLVFVRDAEISILYRPWASQKYGDQIFTAVPVVDSTLAATLTPNPQLFLEWSMDGDKMRLPVLGTEAGVSVSTQLFIQPTGEGNQVEARLLRIMKPATAFLEALKDDGFDSRGSVDEFNKGDHSKILNQFRQFLGGLSNHDFAPMICAGAFRSLSRTRSTTIAP